MCQKKTTPVLLVVLVFLVKVWDFPATVQFPCMVQNNKVELFVTGLFCHITNERF